MNYCVIVGVVAIVYQ